MRETLMPLTSDRLPRACMVSCRAERLLRPRPAIWGGGTPALAAHLGAITDGSVVPYGTLERTALERCAVAGLLARFHGHSHGLRGAGSADSRSIRCYFLMSLLTDPEQHITLPGDDSQAALYICL